MRRTGSLASMLVVALAAAALVACGNQSAPNGGSGGSSASKTKTKTKAPTKAAAAADEGEGGEGDEEDEEPRTPTKTAAANAEDEAEDEAPAGGEDEAPAAPAAGAAAADDEGAPDDLLAQPPRQRGERVHIAQILILFRGSERAGDEITRSRDEARTLARQIQTEARSGDFAAIARQRSEDEASRAGGGDLGEVERGTMPEALDRAAFALAPGAVSDVVESDFGFHVLKRLP